MTFEETKEILKKSIDTTNTMNQAIENVIQSIYSKGYNDAKREIVLSGEYERAYERGKADAQPKTGHWITTRTFMHDGEFYCDKCKCDAPNNEKWHYCPNCGAKMESEDEE